MFVKVAGVSLELKFLLPKLFIHLLLSKHSLLDLFDVELVDLLQSLSSLVLLTLKLLDTLRVFSE